MANTILDNLVTTPVTKQTNHKLRYYNFEVGNTNLTMSGRNRVSIPSGRTLTMTCTRVTYVTLAETTKPVRGNRIIMRADRNCVFLDDLISKVEWSVERPAPSGKTTLRSNSNFHSRGDSHPVGSHTTNNGSLTTINSNLIGNIPTR